MRGAAADGFVAGIVFFGFVVSWTWHFGVVAYFPFVVALAAYWALAGTLVGLAAGRGVRGPWVVASVWTLSEALRGRWPLGGFSWGEFGYALHDVPVARSLAAWGGALLLTFAVVLVAAFAEEGSAGWRSGGGVRAPAALGLTAAVVFTVVAHLALPETRVTGALDVVIVQGNDRNRDLTPEEEARRYLPVNHFDLARSIDGPVDLVILPESSMDEDPRIDPFLKGEIRDIGDRLDAFVLVNASVEIEDGERLENTNILYDPRGDVIATYVKRHLVPYGEWVPARRFLEGLIDEVEQIPRDYAPGDRREISDVRGVAIAHLICFESAFTEIARSYADEGAEILVVSTNNRSFQRSPNAAQHVAMGQIRAIEAGRPVVQAAISGKSAFIDASGDVHAATELFEPTTLRRTVEGRRGRTPYVAMGDWIILAAAVLLACAALRSVATRRFAALDDRS